MVRLDPIARPPAVPGSAIRGASRTLRLAALLLGLSTSAGLAANGLLGGSALDAAASSHDAAIADDPEVAGLINAQMQEAARFGTQLADNVRRRLDGLRDTDCHASDLALRLNLTEMDAAGSANPFIPDTRLDRTLDLKDRTPDARKAATCGDEALAAWTGGFFNYGSFETTGADILDFATLGVSSGIDLQLTPALILGMALGYADDDTRVGADGTRSRGSAASVTAYAGYHPFENAVLDGTLEYDRLDFGSLRASEVSPLRELGPEHATGQRSGHQLSGTLTAGYRARFGPVSLSPSVNLAATATRLDEFAETGAVQALGFGRQSARTLISSVALRAAREIRIRRATLTWTQALEWSHDFGSGSIASFDRRTRGSARRFFVATDRRNVNLFPVTSGVAMRVGKDASLSLDHRVVLGGPARATDHTLRLSFHERF